jgi:hypothetical protein
VDYLLTMKLLLALDEQVPYLPLTASFADRYDQLMLDWYGHWNAEGHAVAADTIDRFLREQGAFEPPTLRLQDQTTRLK